MTRRLSVADRLRFRKDRGRGLRLAALERLEDRTMLDSGAVLAVSGRGGLTGWTPTIVGGTSPNLGSVVAVGGGLVLREGNSQRVSAERSMTVPANPSLLTFACALPAFDATSGSATKDAVELALIDSAGNPLVRTVGTGSDAFLRFDEGRPATLATGTYRDGDYVSVNISGLTPGVTARLVVRLLGNDTDTGSSVTFGADPDGAYRVPGLPGDMVTVNFDITVKSTAYANEVGMVLPQDGTGKVAGLAPGAAGYSRAALKDATSQIVFTSAQGVGARKTVTLPAGSYLMPYAVQNNTTLNAIQQNPDDLMSTLPHTWYSFDPANPDGYHHLRRTDVAGDGRPQYALEDLDNGGDQDFNDVIFTITPQAPIRPMWSSLSGTAYLDVNNDGKKAPSEDGLRGVTVTLTGTLDAGGTVSATTVTQPDGGFSFEHLKPGLYAIAETRPAGLIDAKDTVGSVGGTAGKKAITGIRLLTGSDGTDYLFGHERPPKFVTTPITLVNVSYGTFQGGSTNPSGGGSGGPIQYRYQSGATDADKDPLAYSLVQGPSGMAIDPVTGLVTWTPPVIQTGGTSGGGTVGNPSGGGTSGGTTGSTSADGTYPVTLKASDGRGGIDLQDYTITLLQSAPNHPPIFTSTPVVDANVATPYNYPATAYDPDLDRLTFSVVAGPAGLAIDGTTGVVTWTPTQAQLGLNPVTLKVDDNHGGTATQVYTINVATAPGNHPPKIVSTPITTVASGQLYTYPVAAVDPDGDAPLNYHLALSPAGMKIGALGGRIEWDTTGVAAGPYNVHVVVDDGRGGSDEQDYTVTVTTTGEIRGRKFMDPFPNQLPPVGTPPDPGPINLVPLDTPWQDDISLEYHQPTNSVIASINYGAGGQPRTFTRILADGTQVPFSNAAGLTDEVIMTAARPGNLGGFAAGDVFAGNGQPGQIARVSDGVDVANPWVTLPGETGYLRGAVYLDRTGAWGGDLIAVTTTGGIWRINAKGNATHIATVGRPGTNVSPSLEGVITIPNNSVYGPLAGKILASSENEGGVYAVDAAGNSTFYNLGLGELETLAIIPAGENFYGVSDGTTRLMGAPASSFAGMVGQILLVKEWNEFGDPDSTMWRMFWNGSALQWVPIALTAQSTAPIKWEHVTFAPAGIGTIPDTGGAPGLPDWTIYLDQNHNGVLDAGETSTKTNALGDYAFTGLAPGTYDVKEVQESGWTQVLPTSPTNYSVAVASGQVVRGKDFGNVQVDPRGPNHAPTFASTAILTGQVGVNYRYVAHANDIDHDRLTYDLPVHPAGMAVDPLWGVITWTPTPDQVGSNNNVLLRVEDGRGGVDLQSFQVTVAPANNPPAITTLPPDPALGGVPYKYQMRSVDPDAGDTLTYHLNSGQPGMALDPVTGLLSWPSPAIGTWHIVAQVADNHGAVAVQPFDLHVVNAPGNRAPVFTSSYRTTIQIGRTWLYQPTATDADNDPVTFTLVTPPSGMTIGTDGFIKWTPTQAQFGTNTFTVQAADGRGGVTPQTVTVQVIAQDVNHPPTITSLPKATATLAKAYRYAAVGSDPDGDPLAWGLVAAPTGMAIDPATGVVTWTPTADQVGTTPTVKVRVADGQGGSATQTYAIFVRGADEPPQIISTPETRAKLSTAYSYPVVAVDPEGDPLTYSLVSPPSGMTINATTGLLSWPSPSPLGNQTVTVQVADDQGAVAAQTYTLVVASTIIDHPPTITSKPKLFAAVNVAYQYSVVASDPDGDTPLTYSLSDYPLGMSINSTSGVVTWTPTSAQTHGVTVVVKDPSGATATQTFTLTAAVNHAPTISSTGITSATVGALYRYDVVASDSDGDALTYTMTGPSWLSIDAAGRLSGTPTATSAGQSVTITAYDIYGAASTPQTFSIVTGADAQPPTVQIQFVDNPATINKSTTILVTASDNVGVTSLDLVVGTQHVALDGHGAGRVTLATAADYTVTATAKDAAGNAKAATGTLTVIDPTVTGAPTVAFTSPSDQGVITAPTNIVGTASDANLLSYKLEVAPIDGGPFTTVATGTTSVTNNTLGLFDPTMLANGAYLLRLTARNTGGKSSTATRVVNVTGDLKLGNFHLDFTDVTIPVTGIPITFKRSYDTLDAGRDEGLGYGWHLSFGDVKLKVSQPDGSLQDAGLHQAFVDGTRVLITRDGADPEGFTFSPVPETLFGVVVDYRPRFVPDSGVTTYLAGPDAQLTKLDDGTYVNLDADLTPYNPADPVFGGTYDITTLDGMDHVVNAETGRIQNLIDRHGNTLTFSDFAIASDTGRQITFTRDSSNHITAITDPRGNSVRYGYDANGNLTSVTDRSNDPPTRFTYRTDIPHYVDQVLDPFGRVGVKTTYGPDLRLTGVSDTLGKTTALGYDVANLKATVTAPLTGPATVTLDTQGNVTQMVDPQGNVSTAHYVGKNPDSVTQTVNGTAQTTTFTYDANGSVKTTTDPLGKVSRFTYDAYGHLASASDALGNTRTTAFDPKTGDLLATSDPTGVSTSFAYDSKGHLTSTASGGGGTLGLGGQGAAPTTTARYSYNAYGDMTSTADAYGVITTITPDANGNPTQSQQQWTNPNNAADVRTITATNTFDAEDRLTQIVGPGGTTRTLYDVMGRPYRSIDNLNNATDTLYDVRGSVIQTSLPDGRITRTVYDDKGRATYSDDPHLPSQPADGTHYYYDGLDRVIQTDRVANLVINIVNQSTAPVSALGTVGAVLSTSTMTFDEAGRTKQTRDEAGHVVNYQYDAAGHLTATSDTVAGVARQFVSGYDAAGRRTFDRDAYGHETDYTYDDAGRPIKTTYADGTYATTTYDAQGRLVEDIDPSGLVTRYAYDARGNLTDVTLPMVRDAETSGSPWINPHYNYVYDAYGNLAVVHDPKSRQMMPGYWTRETKYQYDELGRQVSHTLPMGQVETWAYNGLGQLASQTDFDGQKASYTYDSLGRVQRKDLYASGASAPTKTVTYAYDIYDAAGRHDTVTTPDDGVTDRTYDVEGHLIKITSPQGTVSYGYDPATHQQTSLTTANTHVTYAYDQEGRLQTVTADKLNGANLGTPLVTTYGYDLNDNLLSTSLPNGTSETRHYDVMNRLDVLTNKGPTGAVLSSFTYAFDPDGHLTSATENTGRRVGYAYDYLGRLTREAITDAVAGNRTIDYTYDTVGNRHTRIDTGGDPNQRNLNYTYDDNDRLTSVYAYGMPGYSANYTYDANGSTLTVSGSGGVDATTYTWDLEGRLKHADVTDHTTSVTHHTDYLYDDDGSQVSSTTDGQQTKSLVDKNRAFDEALEDYAPGGTLAATYVRGLDLLFEDRAGARSYYAVDGMGSTRALTNTAGAVTDTYTYDAFGVAIGHAGTTANGYQFAGERFDGNLQQYDLRSRYYNPASGRFTSRDTYDGRTSSPLTLNHYTYAGGDPVDNSDPSGHDFSLTASLAGSTIAANITAIEGGVFGYVKSLAERDIHTFEDFVWANVTLAFQELFPGIASALEGLYTLGATAANVLLPFLDEVGFDIYEDDSDDPDTASVSAATRSAAAAPSSPAGGNKIRSIIGSLAKPAGKFDLDFLSTAAHQTAAFYEALLALHLIADEGHEVPDGGWGHKPTDSSNPDAVSIDPQGHVYIHNAKGSTGDRPASQPSPEFSNKADRIRLRGQAREIIDKAQNLTPQLKTKALANLDSGRARFRTYAGADGYKGWRVHKGWKK